MASTSRVSSLSLSSFIEPLESRIAPAVLVYGANLLGGSGNPATGESSSGDHAATLVKVISGQALVWFDGQDIVGISVGPNTKLEIWGDVEGDIIGNLTLDGHLSDSDGNAENGYDGSKLLANNILGITTHPLTGGDLGSISGRVITGGSVSNVNVHAQLSGIYAGNGAYRPESHASQDGVVSLQVGFIDVNPAEPGVQNGFSLDKLDATMLAGASVRNVQVETGVGLQIIAGDGSPTGVALSGKGVAGGNIENITIGSALPGNDTDRSYFLSAGDGANGQTGGAGGSIIRVIEKGASGDVKVQAGLGGNGSTGVGGAGGSIRDLDLQSDGAAYHVEAGQGGAGKGGGVGGSVTNGNFSGTLPNTGLIVTGDFTGDNADDVLVISNSSGEMVLARNSGNGSDFSPVFQNGSSTVISPLGGTIPTTAIAADVNGDGFLDVVVSYRDTNTVGVLLNDGTGNFFDNGQGAFRGFTVPLGFSPVDMLAGNFVGSGATDLAFIETTGDRSTLHVLEGNGATTGNFQAGDRALYLERQATDFVVQKNRGGHDNLFVGYATGQIDLLLAAGGDSGDPFSVVETGVVVEGGVTNLDLDTEGGMLLALSASKKTVSFFEVDGTALTARDILDVKFAGGRTLEARYLHDDDDEKADRVVVLTATTAGALLSYSQAHTADEDPETVDPLYDQGSSVETTAPLKEISVAYTRDAEAEEITGSGIAGIGSSVSRFYFTQNSGSLTSYNDLGLAGKAVDVIAGKGGEGLGASKGGAGGSILTVNTSADTVNLIAGDGGASLTGAAGAGGSIGSAGKLKTVSGVQLVPKIAAEKGAAAQAGQGGNGATGGAGGGINGVTFEVVEQDISLTSGAGGMGTTGAGGAGGNISGVTTKTLNGDVFLTTGMGGNSTGGNGGAGGSVLRFTHTLDIPKDKEIDGGSFGVTVETGNGGSSSTGFGGAGGAIDGVKLSVDTPIFTSPENESDPFEDTTVSISLSTGNGGDGRSGGAGGRIGAVTSKSVFDDLGPSGGIDIGYVTFEAIAGNGGNGTAGNGGAGGSIELGKGGLYGLTSNLPTFFTQTTSDDDVPGLLLLAGDGGEGTAKGGAGGGIGPVTVHNSPFGQRDMIVSNLLESAVAIAGDGGKGGSSDGGAGGTVTGLNFTVAGLPTAVIAGMGGDSDSAKGGAGGSLKNLTIGSVYNLAPYILDYSPELPAITLEAGGGGNGAKAGGQGGSITTVKLQTPHQSDLQSAQLFAGDGGSASESRGQGGAGGNISGISQGKDINSSIDLIQAGNGGNAPLGTGGIGGSVTSVNTVGFIGRSTNGTDTLGVFNEFGNVQGVFAGRGGAGQVATASAGSVMKVTAQQIAAIGASYDPLTQHFAAAAKIAQIQAALIGFDVDRDGAYDSELGAGAPDVSTPIDGFIFSATKLQKVSGIRAGGYVFDPLQQA